MIYTKNKHLPSFDDTIIRSVDSVVNATYFAEDNLDAKAQLYPEQYSNEYRTVFLKLPRRCGKTTYLKKLLDHFESNIGLGRVVLIVPKQVMKHDLYGRDSRVETVQSFAAKYSRGYCVYPRVILYDELHPNPKEKLYLGTKFTLGLYT